MTYLAGHFSSLGGIGRTNLARISPNGVVDKHFQPQILYPVVGAGLFTWGDLALLLEDGSVSVIRPSGLVRSRAMLQGGMPGGLRAVWLAPDFTFVLGSFPTGASPFLLQRFSLLGVLVGSCKVAVKPDQLRVIMQPDGSLIMSGSFPETGAADWSGIRRLNFKTLETISAH